MAVKLLSVILSALLLLGACVTPEVLEPRDGTVPDGVDFTGNWRIRSNSMKDLAQIRDAIRRTDGIKDDDLFRQPDRQSTVQGRQSGRRNQKGGLVHVFLELGEALKVTQTDNALFISFDRSVVEEFRFGENRMVSVGEIQAQRVTGWEGNTLVVDTLDRNNMKLTERFRLRKDGDEMERSIQFRSKAKEEAEVIQVFDRYIN